MFYNIYFRDYKNTAIVDIIFVFFMMFNLILAFCFVLFRYLALCIINDIY